MKYIYSASQNAFFPYSLEAEYRSCGQWPVDGIEVSDTTFSEFTSEAPAQKTRAAGTDGLPYWQPLPPPSSAELISYAEMDKKIRIGNASAEISYLQDAIDLEMTTDEEERSYKAWKLYRVLLSRVDTSTAPEISWPTYPE